MSTDPAAEVIFERVERGNLFVSSYAVLVHGQPIGTVRRQRRASNRAYGLTWEAFVDDGSLGLFSNRHRAAQALRSATTAAPGRIGQA